MRKFIVILLYGIFIVHSVYSDEIDQGPPIINNIWMPTARTLHQNEFAIGIGPVQVGLTENIQLGTNILMFLFQNYNINFKVNFMNSDKLAVASGFYLAHYNLSFLMRHQEFRYNTVSPFLVLSAKAGNYTHLHFSGQFDVFGMDEWNEKMRIGISADQLLIMAGMEQIVSKRTRFLFESGYLVGDAGIQLSFAVLFGWNHFHLKLGAGYINSQNEDRGFTFPVVGFWWQFNS